MSITWVINAYGALAAVGVAAYCLYAVVFGFRSARRENERQREILRSEIQRETRELIRLQNSKIEALERELADTRRQLILAKRQLAQAKKTELACAIASMNSRPECKPSHIA